MAPTEAELIGRFWRRMATVRLPVPDGPPYPRPCAAVNQANSAIIRAELQGLRDERLRSEEASNALRPLNLVAIDRLRGALLSAISDQAGTIADPVAWLSSFVLALELAGLHINTERASGEIRDAIARAERRGYLTGRAEKFATANAALWAARRRLRRRRRVLVGIAKARAIRWALARL